MNGSISNGLTRGRRCLSLGFACLSYICLSLISTELLDAQQTRQNPSPWRPAFGEVNRDTLKNSKPLGPVAQPANQPFNQPTNQPSNQPAAAANQIPTINNGSSAQAGSGQAQSSQAQPAAGANQFQTPSASSTQRQAAQNTAAQNRLAQNTAAQANQVTPGITRVTKTFDKLPNSAGQVWREYDITPYTSQITTTDEPQKAITEWVLRETGTEMWFSQPMGILNADKKRVYVYHTPEIHAVIKKIVDRFNRTRGQVQNVDVNLVTVEKPNWRSQSYTMLQPIEVKSPGVEAWMISKENAAILMSQLSRRSDFKQHSGGRLTNHDGQSFALEKMEPVQFIRNIRWVPNQIPNYEPILSTLNEGYRLNISCLSGMDNRSIEAVIKCDVDQVEKLDTVKINVPGLNGAAQQMNLQIPQLVSWRLHERFRWPNDQVLLLSCGVVATPEPGARSGGLKLPGLGKKSKRADALMFIEYRGPATEAMIPKTAGLAPIRGRQ